MGHIRIIRLTLLSAADVHIHAVCAAGSVGAVGTVQQVDAIIGAAKVVDMNRPSTRWEVVVSPEEGACILSKKISCSHCNLSQPLKKD